MVKGNILSGLQPAKVFEYFEVICGIPHGSSDTKRISDYLAGVAKDRGLRYIQDENNNIIIWKGGSEGYEHSAPVMLQGHMDMVCEKENGCDIDFKKDGLRLRLDDGIISAEGTTLGGDDGIAIAYMLALLDSADIQHPPLECVFTVDEEIGMLGAAALDCSVLQARTMLNMDSEDEGYLLVSCAGGVTASCHIPVEYESAQGGVCMRLSVEGAVGGHSGVEIDKQRANADKVLARVLYMLMQKTDLRLRSINGGLKDNAIPRSASADIWMADGCETAARDCAAELADVICSEYQTTDPEFEISIKRAEDCMTGKDKTGEKPQCVSAHETGAAHKEDMPVMTADSTYRVVSSLFLLPNGVQRMSADIDGLVQTSLNLGILRTADTEVTASFSVRSSVGSEKEALVNQLRCMMELVSGTLELAGDYPAWEYRRESPLRDIMTDVFEQQYGRKPVVQALHAGVECGLFAGRLPGLDCVSFGPDMKDIHTPQESMDVASVARTWDYLIEVLRRLR